MNNILKIAHRGYSARFPENTLLAFNKAIESGAGMIELDVQMSMDGRLVVIHDESIDRTSDGRGMIRDLTLNELKQFDFACRAGGGFERQEIPLLEEVIDIARNKVMLNIEIKNSPVRYDGIEEALVKVLTDCSFIARSIVSSFEHDSLIKIKKLHPFVKTGMLYECIMPDLMDRVVEISPYSIHPSIDSIDPAQMKWAKEKGLRVYAWVAESVTEIEKLISTGFIDGIMVNELELFS
jgi:glycerophosphoryl diester phosphodiesterase